MAMQSKKKIMVAAIAGSMAAALIIGGGSFAFLKSNSETITNNFKTNKVEVDIDETDGENKQYQYNIIPGTEEKKNPVAYITTTVPAYLFVTITDETDDLVTYDVITGENGWTKLDGKDNVYYRTVEAKEGQQNFDILKNNKVSYDSGIENKDMAGKDDIKLSFDVFGIQQAGFADAAAAYAQAPVKVSNQEELDAALANAKDGDSIQLAANAEAYKLPASMPKVSIIGQTPKTTSVDAGAWFNTNSNNPVVVDISNVSFVQPENKDRILQGAFSGDFDNCVFDNGTKWAAIYNATQTGDITFRNCTFRSTAYDCNFGKTKGTLKFENCDFTGWSSFGDGGQLVFKNCKFHKSNSYGVICSWTDITIEDCELDSDIEIYAHKVPKVWKINNTTKGGTKITAANIKTMFDISDTDVTDIWNLCELYVDGTRVAAD